MESMPSTRRAKIDCAEQTSASYAKEPAVIMMIDRSSPSAWKRSPRRKSLFDFAIRSLEMHIVLVFGRGDNRGILVWCQVSKRSTLTRCVSAAPLVASALVTERLENGEMVGRGAVAGARERGNAAFDTQMPGLAELQPPRGFRLAQKFRAKAITAVA